MLPLIAVEIHQEHDVVLARHRARQVARLLGFDSQDQSRITTAVSEIARNAFEYGGGGRATFAVDANPAKTLTITISDQGRGIPHLEKVLDGVYQSKNGMGVGIVGARRLMDRLEIDSKPGKGTRVMLTKEIAPRSKVPARYLDLAAIGTELARSPAFSPFHEIQQQNQELVRVLDELNARQTELDARQRELDELNRELADTNRGVMALYAQLDEKAQQLERANELKTSFLSNVSHEFRTPLNSIVGLANLLLDRMDGPLTEEQARQVFYMRRSAESLAEQVNDLLDTARIESGKVTLDLQEFTVEDLFSSLRGMFRPLVTRDTVALVFDDAEVANFPPLHTDEGKLSQIMRNFLSNAIKFTENGTIRVTAATGSLADTIVFAVADQGIGIASADRDRVFEEFGQVEGALQRRVKGTGLGLPLTRKLSTLLGGFVEVESEVGVGSTFSVTIPIHCPPLDEIDAREAASYV